MRIRYPKLRELRYAIKAIFSKPYTSPYPHAPHKAYERFRGRPYFREEDCVGCTACAQVCPSKAIEVEDIVRQDSAKRKLTVHWDICIFCGQCEANCLTGKGIKLSQEYDFATTENRQDLKNEVEKDFVICECCGEPIVPRDQYAWVAKKIGPLCFSNASLLLFYFRKLSLAFKEKFAREKTQTFRSDRIKILCPSCRREACLKS